MKAPQNRMQTMRAQRRAQGLVESTIWISEEEKALLEDFVRERQLKNRSDAVRLAIRQLAKERNSMSA